MFMLKLELQYHTILILLMSGLTYKPLKVFHTNGSNIIMYNTHGVDKFLLGLLGADHLEVHEEVV